MTDKNEQLNRENFRIGHFYIEVDRLRITLKSEDSQERSFQVEPLVMAVLCFLTEQAGQVVSHDEVITHVWGSEHGTQERLVRAISLLRKIFREGGDTDGFIETIPKRGYRFTGEISGYSNQEAFQANPDYSQATKRVLTKKLAYSAAFLAGAFCLVIFWSFYKPEHSSSEPVRQTNTHSIAILPFLPLSGKESLVFFSQSFTGKLLVALNNASELSLISVDSVEPHRDSTLENTNFVLKGIVEESDSQYQVFVQLIDTSNQQTIWSETIYKNKNNPNANIDIAQEISRILQARLGVGIGKGRVGPEGIDPSAYEHYLQGVALWPERNNPVLRHKAITALRMAVSQEQNFADAWARYSAALVQSLPTMSGLSAKEADQEAFSAFQHALNLDPKNARAHLSAAAYFLRRTAETTKAESHALNAIAIDPQIAEAHYILAMTYLAQGNYKKAHRSFDASIARDPDNVIPRLHKIFSLASKGDLLALQAVLSDCERCTNPSYTYAEFVAAVQTGSSIRAKEMINKYLQSVERYIAAGGSRANVSNEDEFYDIIEIFVEKRGKEIGWREWMTNAPPSMLMASAYANIGEHHQAIKMIKVMISHSAFLERFELVSHGGPFSFPREFTSSEEYREIWNSPAMKDLAEIRRLNGREEGLPPKSH